MAYISESQVMELSDECLEGKKAKICRNDSVITYKLIKYRKGGMKGVVWKAKNDIGEDVALKIIPSEDYTGRSITDEISEASKLGSDWFADIKFFGDFSISGMSLSSEYKAITTTWIDGPTLKEFVNEHRLSVDDYIVLANQLFRVLAILRNKDLCHDDLHADNVLIEKHDDALTSESTLRIKVIDTGTIKRCAVRDILLSKLREKIEILKGINPKPLELNECEKLLAWKSPDDHLRIIECLLISANGLVNNYHKFDFWERKFVDQLFSFFQRATDNNLGSRLDDPDRLNSELLTILRDSKAEESDEPRTLSSPFNYISAEMIRNDKEFAELFSKQCPWLNNCLTLEPIYLYGPRGCGKSSVLRWLSFKTRIADDETRNIEEYRDIGIYVSCSVELRSRFWLLNEETINKLQTPIIRFFNLLLLEELFDVLVLIWNLDDEKIINSGFKDSDLWKFTDWVLSRISQNRSSDHRYRLQGQSHLEYLRGVVRNEKWDTWARIQKAEEEKNLPDPSLVSDVCRQLPEYFNFFQSRHLIFLIDDYSNQRIPNALQKKLNQTISFAKQGSPIFKVSSEYQGVDLEGIQEGREVIEINIGEQYTSLKDPEGFKFLADILNLRLKKAGYEYNIEKILGKSKYNDTGNMARAIAEDGEIAPFHYYGIDCIHWLCSGDVALALDLIKKIFDKNNVTKMTDRTVSEYAQHQVIQEFSHQETRRIKYIVPHGEDMLEIVSYLGFLARAFLKKASLRKEDNVTEPSCRTHLDIRIPAILDLKKKHPNLFNIYHLLTSRAILFSLSTSRSRISLSTERLQVRRIYFPAFKAPLKRDTPIKIDTYEDLASLLSNPKAFAQRELKKADIKTEELDLAISESRIKPRDN